MSPVPCTLTASQLSVTKAGGLSDTLGAESSTGGGSGDTVTYVRLKNLFIHRCSYIAVHG